MKKQRHILEFYSPETPMKCALDVAGIMMVDDTRLGKDRLAGFIKKSREGAKKILQCEVVYCRWLKGKIKTKKS